MGHPERGWACRAQTGWSYYCGPRLESAYTPTHTHTHTHTPSSSGESTLLCLTVAVWFHPVMCLFSPVRLVRCFHRCSNQKIPVLCGLVTEFWSANGAFSSYRWWGNAETSHVWNTGHFRTNTQIFLCRDLGWLSVLSLICSVILPSLLLRCEKSALEGSISVLLDWAAMLGDLGWYKCSAWMIWLYQQSKLHRSLCFVYISWGVAVPLCSTRYLLYFLAEFKIPSGLIAVDSHPRVDAQVR